MISSLAPGTQTLARGIFSTPSYPEKAGAPCVLSYSIALYRLSSRVGDKRTQTADIRHRVNHRLSGPD
ncbi:hypothetical protein HN51_009039 [Arachis hypogaea]